MAVLCEGFMVRSAPKANGYWDMNIVTLSTISMCGSASCETTANTPSCIYVFQEVGLIDGSHPVKVEIYKDGSLYQTHSKVLTASDEAISFIILDTGIWSAKDDWNKIDIGKNLSLPEGTYTGLVTVTY